METVTAPDGRTWTVRRRWSREPRWRRRDVELGNPLEAADAVALSPSSSLAEMVAGLALIVLVGVVLAFFVAFLLPFVVFVAEVAVLAVGAYLLGRPWTIEATTAGPPAETLTWQVRGWRRSRRAVEEVAREVGRGDARVAPDGGP